jgi:hypothetical protein
MTEALQACCALQNIDGDGRWKIEWYGVPCNVGGTKLDYRFKVKQYYWFELVVSNTRIPILGVSVYINGKWMDLARSVTNTWPYHRVTLLAYYTEVVAQESRICRPQRADLIPKGQLRTRLVHSMNFRGRLLWTCTERITCQLSCA